MNADEVQEKERRKQLRRNRIADHAEKENLDNKRPPSSSQSAHTKYPSDQRIAESFARLDHVQASSTDRVTRSRVYADQREAKRRDDEDEDNFKRNALAEKADRLDNKDEVAAGWKECSSATNAQDLCELLNKQKALCEGAISKLEDVSKELGSQLRQKDHEYVTALKRNRQEIEMLQSCIEQEHNVLKNVFEAELKLIEESLNADKAKITRERKRELDALMTERNKVELQSLEQHRKIIEKQRADINASETNGGRDTMALKEKLESELRRLEIQLEETRTRHQFESDKLEFDVRVLDELSDNNAEIKKQKRRIMKGKEELNKGIEAKQREQENGAKENQILEDDCERIERQSNGLKEKFERFKISDSDKFRSLLALHKDDLQKLQDELDKSRDFIFGGEIGCYANEELSCISNISQHNDISSVINGDCKRKNDVVDFGLEDEDNNESNDRDKCDEWQQAETLMSNYKNMLEQREGLHTEVRVLEQQSNKLKEELRARLNDKVNEELAFPPSNMINMDCDEKKDNSN